MRDSLWGRLARRIVRRLVRLYYPNIEISHPERIPSQGPVLLCANHPNSMLDPVIVGISAQRPVRFLAKAPLFKIPVFGRILTALGMLPAYREQDAGSDVSKNVQSLDAGAAMLCAGDAMGIFPEGKTHDAPRVEMVRSGAARIAMAAAKQGAPGLKIVPLGINYEAKERFRSAVWVRVGEPIDAAEWLSAHENDERKAMRGLTRELDKRLKELAVHLNEEKWAPLAGDLEAILPPEGAAARQPAAPLRQRKRICDAINYFFEADLPRAEHLAAALEAHRAAAKDLKLEADSPVLCLKGASLLWRMLREPFWLAVFLFPALLGTLHHLLPFALVRLIAPRLQTPGRTTVSMARLGLSLPIYAAWYAFCAWWWIERWAFVPLFVGVYLGTMPFCGVLALNYGPRAREAGRMWWRQMRLLGSAKLAALRQERTALKLRLNDVAAEFRRLFPPEAVSSEPVRAFRPKRWLARLAVAAALTCGFLFASYWRGRAQTIPELRGTGPDLSVVSEAVLREYLAGDDAALAGVLESLDGLEARSLALLAQFESGKRSFYKQEDNDEIRRLMLSYMGYRAALLRVIWRYRNYEQIEDPGLRARAFLTGYTAASALWEVSLRFVALFRESPNAVKKLNEAEPLWDIPAGMYDHIRANLARRENRTLMGEARAQYEARRAEFAARGLDDAAPFAAFHAAIARSWATDEDLGRSVWKEKVSLAVGEAEALGKEALYHGQSLVATWIGDTKIREPRGGDPLITHELLEEIRPKLQPGDILIERRNWFLSNAFLPGYWPHAAIYVGTPEDLRRMSLDQDPQVRAKWEAFCEKDAEGHEHVIVEALSEGVVFATLEHSIGGGDAVAILRPKLPPERIRAAIAKAFGHQGKPYDFEFDFFSTDKIVCTELVFRCYDPEIEFPLVDVMGRQTLPAIEMVRKYAGERGRPGAQLEFVAFVDGNERTGACEFKDDEAFVQTLERPGMTFFQPRE